MKEEGCTNSEDGLTGKLRGAFLQSKVENDMRVTPAPLGEA
jgi:hypothetical protein